MFPTAVITTRRVLVLLALVGVLVATTSAAWAPASAAGASSKVYFVQGVPGTDVAVKVDGRSIDKSAAAKAVLGPVELASGQHTVTFTSTDWTVKKTFDASKSSMDVVLHWPADPADEPVTTVFTNKVGPVAAGKGRLTVAHTAVVPPADVRVAGKVLFANIANGEFVTAEVPADGYSVDIVPTGETKAILGPVDLGVKAGVLTRVFAIGAPEQGSMDAIVQVLPLPRSGSQNPGSVNAGSAGLVAPGRTTEHGGRPDIRALMAIGALAALVAGAVVGGRRHADR